MADDLDDATRKAKRLLAWATILALVAVAVLALDVLIKNAILAEAKEAHEILAEAKESQSWIDRLREDIRSGRGNSEEEGSADPAGGSAGVAGVDGVADGPGAPEGSDVDARM